PALLATNTVGISGPPSFITPQRVSLALPPADQPPLPKAIHAVDLPVQRVRLRPSFKNALPDPYCETLPISSEAVSLDKAIFGGRLRVIGQVDAKFIACRVQQLANDRSPLLVLVDQHAADERVRLEQLLAHLD
ncbi:hypothetical protein H4R33_007145, partial [Dimargaris cristalligena]